MKHPLHLLRTAALLAALSPLAGRAQLVSGNDHVRIEVRVQTEQERKSIKGTTVDTVTQGKTLAITLTGKAKNPETRTGTWQAYARDVKDNKIVAADSGPFTIDFSKGAQKVESKKITMTYTPEHSSGSGGYNKGGGGGGGGGGQSSKKVPAEGTKFAGYGIVVKDGDKIVGEFYDPVGLKSEAAK